MSSSQEQGKTKEQEHFRSNKSRSPQEEDPFFKDYYDRLKNRRNHPYNGRRHPSGTSSIFENDDFVDDLRRKIEEDRKMFFDADPWGDFPSHHGHRGASPGPQGQQSNSSAGSGRASAGFPFDDARSRFEDFPGPRRPMFSTMRRPQWEEDPFHHPFHRERHNSGSSGGGGGCASGSSSASTGEEHIIPIRIERGDGTTTTSTAGASATAAGGQHNAHAKPAAKAQQQHNPNPISTTPIPMPPPEGMSPTPEPPIKMQHIPGPQRSSTDEVKKSPSPSPSGLRVERNVRAQSAPPDSSGADGGGTQTFVTNAHIQINPEQQQQQNSTTGPQPPEQQQQQQAGPQGTQFGGKMTKEKTPPRSAGQEGVRPIPIFVEGRGPVINQNQRTFAQTQQSAPQQKASRPAETRDVTPPPVSKKQTLPKDPLEKVADITSDVKELEAKIDEFTGASKNKDYLYLDEMLTRNLIKLDVIETEGREDVRVARKDCIKLIQACISKLESKIPSSVPQKVSGDGDQQQQQQQQSMEVDQQDQPSSQGEKMEEDHQANDNPPKNANSPTPNATSASNGEVKVAA